MAQTSEILAATLNVIPQPVFIVDGDMRVIDLNEAGRAFLEIATENPFSRKTGDVIHCIPHYESPQGCGHSPACRQCVIRNSVGKALVNCNTTKKYMRLTVKKGTQNQDVDVLVTTAALPGHTNRIIVVLENIPELMALRGLVPICASCRRVRTDTNYWQHLESYLSHELNLTLTHGICPECTVRVYPGIAGQMKACGKQEKTENETVRAAG